MKIIAILGLFCMLSPFLHSQNTPSQSVIPQSPQEENKMLANAQENVRRFEKCNALFLKYQNDARRLLELANRCKAEGKDGEYDSYVKYHQQTLANAKTVEKRSKQYYGHSMVLLDQLIGKNPKLAQAYRLRAAMYFYDRQLDKVVQDFSQIIAIEPNDIQCRFDRGYVCLQMGNLKEAIHDFQHCIEKNYKPEESYMQMAKCLLGVMDWKNSRASLEHCIQAKHKLQEAYFIQSLLFFYENRFAESVQPLQNLLAMKEIEANRRKSFELSIKIAENLQKSYEKELLIQKEETGKLPQVKIFTPKGVLVAELFTNHAPHTVGKFIERIQQKKYDQAILSDTTANYIAQVTAYSIGKNDDQGQYGCEHNEHPGCEDSDCQNCKQGNSDHPDHEKHARPRLNSLVQDFPIPNVRKHFGGFISAPVDSSTMECDFFFTYIPLQQLDGKCVVFGRILEGMDVLKNLKKGDTIEKLEILPR